MLGDIKKVDGIIFETTGILVRFVDMSLNKRSASDPDYYSVVIDVNGDFIETSAWFGTDISKWNKNPKDSLYKEYKFVFHLAKQVVKSRSGADITCYKPKVIGIKPINII